MTKIDFSKCDFIEKNMWFITYTDFCERRKIIAKLFNTLDLNAKTFYMWYVYANIHCSETFKNAIWDYLNFQDSEYEEKLLNLKAIYRVR